MRKVIISFCLLAIVSSMYAQKPDDVTIKSSEDKFTVGIAGFNIGFSGSEKHISNVNNDTLFHVENNCGTNISVIRKRPASVHFGLIGPFYFGWNNWVNSQYYGNWTDQGDFLRISSAFAFSMSFCNLSVSLNQSHSLRWIFGAKWTITNYRFMSQMRLADDSNGRLMPVFDNERPNSMLRTSYLGFPMGLQYHVQGVNILATVSAEWLTNSWTRYSGEDSKFPLSGVNTFRSTAELIVGYHGIGAFVDYGLTPLFNAGVGNDVHAIAAGFLICL